MSNLTQQAFTTALADKFTAAELVELLGIEPEQLIDRFYDWVLLAQKELEDELKYGH